MTNLNPIVILIGSSHSRPDYLWPHAQSYYVLYSVWLNLFRICVSMSYFNAVVISIGAPHSRPDPTRCRLMCGFLVCLNVCMCSVACPVMVVGDACARWALQRATLLAWLLAGPLAAPRPEPCAGSPLCSCRDQHMSCIAVPLHRFPGTAGSGCAKHHALWHQVPKLVAIFSNNYCSQPGCFWENHLIS